MKRIFSIILTLSLIIATFSSCASFQGGITTFYKNGNFYEKVGGVISSIFGGSNSYVPLIGNSPVQLDVAASVSKYEYGNTKLSNDGTLDASFVVTPNLDFELKSDLDMFGQNASVHCLAEKDSFYIDFGKDSKMPYYYKGEGNDDITQKVVTEVLKAFKEGSYINGEEVYKIHGEDISANTIEICLNSDKTTEIINYITDLFIETKNLIYSGKVMQVLDYSYIVKGEKLHLTWKRYFNNDNNFCREIYKIHDNNGHYIQLDTAYLSKSYKEYVELAVNAFDGDGVFNVFALSAQQKTENDAFETEAKILVGDYVQIELKNKGTTSSSNGTANVHFMTEIGVADLPIKYSYSATPNDNLQGFDTEHKYTISSDSIYISFEAELSFTATLTDKTPTISVEGDYYDVSDIANQYYYNESKTIHNKEYKDILTLLCGNTPEPDPEPSKSEVEPFKLDIHYDYSTIYDTNGEYGERYINLLHSDSFTYSYTYHANEEGYPLNKCTQYRKDGENLYVYNYADGTEYAQLFSGTTRYEVRHDLEKILFTEYSEEDFKIYYPEQIYRFYESGLCNYENRELVYEKYYDQSNNKYTFIFDEYKNVELIVIEASSDKSLLFTFVETITDAVPDNAMKLPSYTYESVLDHFE